MSKGEQISEALTDLGLEELEAEIYVALLRNGPSQAGSIVALSDASRGKVYDVLNSLVSEGLAEKSAGNPATYRPVDPEDVFETTRQDLQQKLEYVDLMERQLLGDLEEVAAADNGAVDATWEVIEGRASIYKRLRTSLESAEESVRAVNNHNVTLKPVPAVEKTWQTLTRKADTLDVRVLVDDASELIEAMDEFDASGVVEVRKFSSDDVLHFVEIDGEEIFFWLVPSQRHGIHQHDDVVARTNAPGVQHAVDLLFGQLWPSAKPLEPIA